MLSLDFSNISYDQSYKKAISKCLEEWNSTKTNKELIDAVILSSQTYMLPKEVWDEVKEHINSAYDHSLLNFKEKMELLKALVKPACFHFYFGFSPYGYVPDRKDVNWYPTDEVHDVPQKYANFCFSFPHKSLTFMWKNYSEHLTAPPPNATKESYQRMKKLFQEIIEAEDDTEKWYEILKNFGDETVIEHNLELRLGQNLNDKKLWKFYMDFLEERDIVKLFQAYEKYCNFFLDDIPMKVKYNELALKYEYFIPVDIFVPGEPQGISADEIWDEYSPETVQSPTHYFNHQNKIFQNFPFRRPFLNYIVENANGKVLEKLFKTCKLFYWFFPVQICYKLEFGWGWAGKSIRFRDNSVHLTSFLSQNDFPNIIIANSFHFSGDKKDNHLSNLIIPRLYKCEAKHINISGQNFTLNEFEMLVGHGNVMSLELVRVEITDCKTGNTQDAADILKFTPKVESIFFIDMCYYNNTTQKLLEIPFQNKIEDLAVSFRIKEIEPFEFAQFLQKNVSSTCNILLGFDEESENVWNHFWTIMDICVAECWPGKYRPTLDSF